MLDSRCSRIGKYSSEADRSDTASVRKHAAHVAAWIAYGPKGRIPEVDELQLLQKFLTKVGGGLLPARLREVLPDAQCRLQSVPKSRTSVAWQQAGYALEARLQKFRCCQTTGETALRGTTNSTNATAKDLIPVAADVVAKAWLPVVSGASVTVAKDSTLRASTSQNLELFHKMNQWGLMDHAQRLQRLKQAEAAARSASQADLVEVVNLAAAALSSPRRLAILSELAVDATEASCEQTAHADPEALQAGIVQQRVRTLLLRALWSWRANLFECHAIQHVLEYVKSKISKFEDKVGGIQDASAGKVWLCIKRAVDELLHLDQQHVLGQAAISAARTLADTAMRRLERQSGIQGISWHTLTSAWRVAWHDGCKRKRVAFSITQLLKQGLEEDEAVAAALQRAKTFREELVEQGKLQPPKPVPAAASSVRGVWFDKAKQKWKVQLTSPATRKRQCAGSFQTQEEAETKARKLAKKFGVQAEAGQLEWP